MNAKNNKTQTPKSTVKKTTPVNTKVLEKYSHLSASKQKRLAKHPLSYLAEVQYSDNGMKPHNLLICLDEKIIFAKKSAVNHVAWQNQDAIKTTGSHTSMARRLKNMNFIDA